jgi:hypothetical protein
MSEAGHTVEVARLSIGGALRGAVGSIRGRGWPVMLLGPIALGFTLVPAGFVRFAAYFLFVFLMAGGYSIALGGVRGEPARPALLFDGFRRDRRLMVAVFRVAWPYALSWALVKGYAALLHMPAILSSGPLFQLHFEILILMMLLSLGTLALVAPQLPLAVCSALDGVPESASAIYRFTWELLRGNRIRATALFLALNVLTQLMWRFEPVGLLFMVPLTLTIGATVYEQLRGLSLSREEATPEPAPIGPEAADVEGDSHGAIATDPPID